MFQSKCIQFGFNSGSLGERTACQIPENLMLGSPEQGQAGPASENHVLGEDFYFLAFILGGGSWTQIKTHSCLRTYLIVWIIEHIQ